MAPSRPNLVILLLIGLAVVVLAAVQVPSGVTPPTTTTIPPLRTVALPQASDQIAADFQETFVTLATDGDPALLVVEPGSRTAEVHPLHWDVAWSLQLDEAASWLATLPVRGHPGRLVIRPVRGGTEIDRSGVTSFAWHSTDPGRLAWV
ncbi:MAG: hypothetical protein KY460_04100, partial [Actinobacteria bacterium]|nr:hypothetical protein [Actinomycetota bacterium]